ncbi:hypothetical protein Ahy_B04g071976 [Arachis hypogaea]|uniref:Uncharacterized protein n=1 Tax=Arachis hypogaea TaxID=3818 RepID=A0A444ZM51_ARAHY|nr:hypothetical protein Ahy_B04g071976 [Arachis hypogaea]
MARQAGNDGDINRLNETSYYSGIADFERSRLLLSRRVSHTHPSSDAILLGVKPPVAPQHAAQRKESFTLKLVCLRDRVRQMPPPDDLETLRHYARCYIMLLIGGYLMMDKSKTWSTCVGSLFSGTLGSAGRCLGDRPC